MSVKNGAKLHLRHISDPLELIKGSIVLLTFLVCSLINMLLSFSNLNWLYKKTRTFMMDAFYKNSRFESCASIQPTTYGYVHRRTQIQAPTWIRIPNPMGRLYCAEYVHIAPTWIQIAIQTPFPNHYCIHFWDGYTYPNWDVSNVNKPLKRRCLTPAKFVFTLYPGPSWYMAPIWAWLRASLNT